MRARMFAAVALLVVGLGAVTLVVFHPGSNAGESNLLTARATTTDVVEDVVASGTLSANATYSLAFGSDPELAAASSSAASNGGNTTTWLVKTVAVALGDRVTAGEVLATADTAAATQTLTLAQADLATAQARLTADVAGPTSADKATAYDQVRQAQQNLSQAKTSQTNTVAQNNLRLAQAKQAVTDAQAQLDADTTAAAPDNVLSADADALQRAKDDLATTQVQVKASNDQAANQVASAKLSLSTAQNSYASRVTGTAAAQIASDQAAVDRAQAAVDDAQHALDQATIKAPADGIVSAVSIVPNVVAPSGAAIELQTDPLEVVASVAETDRPKLKAGQAASLTITALGQTVTGHVVSISPTASTGGQSSVVSYPVTVVLDQTPTGSAIGMTADVTITINQAAGVVAVPTAAVTTTAAGASTVRVVAADGSTEVRSVEIGLVSRTFTEIKSGITAGETVVIGTASSRTGTTNQGGGNALGGGNFVNGGGGFRP
jgi:RND family efflux transporter MFP subunit